MSNACPSKNLGRGKQGEAIRADIRNPQVDDRGPRLMSTPHRCHRERLRGMRPSRRKGKVQWKWWSSSASKLMTQSRKGSGTRHGVATMECHGGIEHRPTTMPSTMSGGLNGGGPYSEILSARLQARPIRECMMNDFSRDGSLRAAVQRSLEEKPDVYRCSCCVGCVLRQNTCCKSLFQVCPDGRKGCNTGNQNAVEVQTRLKVYRQHNLTRHTSRTRVQGDTGGVRGVT